MNGVRRFLGGGGGGGASDTQSPGPPAPLDLGSPPSSAGPFNSVSTAQLKSPPTTTAALFLRKREKSRPPQSTNGSNSGSIDEGRGSTRARSNTNSSSSSASGLARKSGSEPAQRNMRDELLLSLLASEAVIESRDFAILSSEEVEELKKEESILTPRLSSLERKLETERKIRDAAATLSALSGPRNSSKPVNSNNSEQLEVANKRFDETQKEVWRITQAKSDVSRRLMEHRARVLSESMRRIEEGNLESASGLSTPSLASPTSSFNGFFAGHPSSAVPTATSLFPQAARDQISQLEEQLRAATTSLAEASKKQAKTTRELNLLTLEKDQVETMLGMEIQAAQDKVTSLEDELPSLEVELENLRSEKGRWEKEQDLYEQEKTRWESEKRLLEEIQEAKGGSDALLTELRQDMLGLREQLDAKDIELRDLGFQLQTQLDAKDAELRDLGSQLQTQVGVKDAELLDLGSQLQTQLDAKDDELRNLESRLSQTQNQLTQTRSQLSQVERAHADATEDLDSGRAFIQSLVQTHAIVLFTRDSSLKGLLGAIGTHIETLSAKLLSTEQASAQKEIEHRQREAAWESQKRRLEQDVRSGLDKREGLSRELDTVRREKEDIRQEMKDIRDSRTMSPTNGQHFVFPPTPSTPSRSLSHSANPSLSNTSTSGNLDNVDLSSTEVQPILSVLKSLWSILPSPEARAAKFASSRERAFRTASGPSSSPTMSNVPPSPGGGTPKSISDLDVRSLKSLYDSSKNPSVPSPQSEFTLPSFISRIQSLLNDDRLLIERLLRFAQAHDLLKKNAERAQKLASEANTALETYSRQVRILEDRNGDLVKRCAELQGELAELQGLQEVVDRISAAKSDIEIQAAEQAETCRQLTEANKVLSARALALAEEATQAPEMIRRQMQKEINEMKIKLASAETTRGSVGASISSGAQAALQTELDRSRKELKEALEEIEAMRTSSQTQNVMLMDELMVTQIENAELKEQLRALKK